jgi:hypothetical protein
VSLCVLIMVFALVYRAGDLSVDARDFIQDRLTALRSVLQQN